MTAGGRMLPCVVVGVLVSTGTPAPTSAEPPAGGVPLTLRAAVETALDANPEIRRAREQGEESRLRVQSARADALPTLDATATLQRTRDPGLRNSPFFSRLREGDSSLPADALGAFQYGTYVYQLEVEQPLYQFGRVRHAVAAARHELEGVQADIRSVEHRIALDVALAYYDLLLARARRDVLGAERLARERQLQQVRDRLDLGEATRLDVLQAGVAVANLRPEVLIADNAIRVALTRLNETLGREPLAPFEPAERLVVPVAAPVVPDTTQLVRLAATQRPERQRYILTRQVLAEAERVTRADTLPEVSARATLGISSLDVNDLVRPSLHGWTAGVNVRWTLFDGHRTQSTMGQYRSQRRQSELEEEAFLARLARDIERASGTWRQAVETIEVSTLAIDQAREARRVAEDHFSAGAATFLDVLDAERALRQAELVHLEASHSALTTLAEIKVLVGLRPEAPDAALAVHRTQPVGPTDVVRTPVSDAAEPAPLETSAAHAPAH
jgi:outer membrane protein